MLKRGNRPCTHLVRQWKLSLSLETAKIINCKWWLQTSYLPPEHARDRGVSLVRSDWASMCAPALSRVSTTLACPAVAANIRGVKPFLSLCSVKIKVKSNYLDIHNQSKTFYLSCFYAFFKWKIPCKYTEGHYRQFGWLSVSNKLPKMFRWLQIKYTF